jgi:hypothetical protein
MPFVRLTSARRDAANPHVLADFAEVGREAVVCVQVDPVTAVLVAGATS